MGSKSRIMDFVLDGINQVDDGRGICDLFSGSGSLAGAIGQQCPVHSNDIQRYSRVLADTYNKAFIEKGIPTAAEIIKKAEAIVERNRIKVDGKFDKSMSLKNFNDIENKQRELIDRNFEYEWHLFSKYYSGTWWSYEQCLWIDAIREVAETYKKKSFYPVVLSSLMFGMAYACLLYTSPSPRDRG